MTECGHLRGRTKTASFPSGHIRVLGASRPASSGLLLNTLTTQCLLPARKHAESHSKRRVLEIKQSESSRNSTGGEGGQIKLRELPRRQSKTQRRKTKDRTRNQPHSLTAQNKNSRDNPENPGHVWPLPVAVCGGSVHVSVPHFRDTESGKCLRGL